MSGVGEGGGEGEFVGGVSPEGHPLLQPGQERGWE